MHTFHGAMKCNIIGKRFKNLPDLNFLAHANYH